MFTPLVRGMINWLLNLQNVIVLSTITTTKVEYMAVTQTYKKAIQIQKC